MDGKRTRRFAVQVYERGGWFTIRSFETRREAEAFVRQSELADLRVREIFA